MGINIRIKKPTNHALILRVMLRGLGLEKFNALFAQCQSDLYALLAESQLAWRRKKVWNHLSLAKGFICVFYFSCGITLACASISLR